MLEQPEFALSDPAVLRELVREHPWVTLMSATPQGPVVSHLPVILDRRPGVPADSVAVLGHLARADAALHQLGEHPVVLVVQGPHGYLSASWYQDGPHVPTWDFVVLHLHGRPTVLGDDETLTVLGATVDALEEGQPQPWRLDLVPDYARRIAPATTGFSLAPTRVVGKAKLSQDQAPHEVARLADALLAGRQSPSSEAVLAAAMRSTLAGP